MPRRQLSDYGAQRAARRAIPDRGQGRELASSVPSHTQSRSFDDDDGELVLTAALVVGTVAGPSTSGSVAGYGAASVIGSGRGLA